jgi:hypothetical protein
MDKDSYKEVIAEDIKLVEQYIPKTFMVKEHILTVLRWSIDKAYPPEYWDRVPCPDCQGEGYMYFVDQGEPDPGSICDRCKGTGKIAPVLVQPVPEPPAPPPARLLKEGEKPIPPPSQHIREGEDPVKYSCSPLLPDGFVFAESGRVILDPKKYPKND